MIAPASSSGQEWTHHRVAIALTSRHAGIADADRTLARSIDDLLG